MAAGAPPSPRPGRNPSRKQISRSYDRGKRQPAVQSGIESRRLTLDGILADMNSVYRRTFANDFPAGNRRPAAGRR
jgi:hypothetical protein